MLAQEGLVELDVVGEPGCGFERSIAVEVDVREARGQLRLRTAEVAAGKDGDAGFFEEALAQVDARSDAALSKRSPNPSGLGPPYLGDGNPPK